MATGRCAVIGEEEERTIYVRVERSMYQTPERKQGEYDWFAITAKDELLSKDDEGFLLPAFKMPPKCHYMSACAALGPYLYVIGGLEHKRLNRHADGNIYRDVYYIDTRRPRKGWKAGPSLIKARTKSYAAVIDGKIYVFGALWNSNHHPWAEVLDPQLRKWSPLPMDPADSDKLPFDVCGHAVVRGGSDNRPEQLLVHGHFWKTLHSYDFASEKWTLVDDNFGAFYFQSAVVGDVMYFIKGKVYAYHLKEGRWFSQPVGGFDDNELPYHHPKYHMTLPSALVHVGNGVLCLLWSDKPDHSKLPMDIYCNKFTVSMEPSLPGGECVPVAHIKSFKIYKVKGLTFLDCVATSMSAEVIPCPVKESVEGGDVCCKKKKHKKKNKDKSKLLVVN